MELTIDDKDITAHAGQTILEAALAADLYIPHLCYHQDLPSFDKVSHVDVCYRGGEAHHSDSQAQAYQGCGLCLVHVKDKQEPVLSCVTPVEEGMEVAVSTPEIETLRKKNLASILTDHPHACLTCAQREGCSLTQCSTNVPEEERCCPLFDVCELRKVAEYVGIKEDITRYVPSKLYVEEDKPLFIRDYNLCVGCLRCVRMCEEVIGAGALGYIVSDGTVIVGTKGPSIEEAGCRYCGACVEVCPTGALRDKELKPGDRRDALVPCAANCPVGIDVPSYVYLIQKGEFGEAARIIRDRVPLVFTLGYVCSHPCEDDCRRGKLNQPIAICDLKRFALEATKSEEAAFEPLPRAAGNGGKKVAVVGSGPAGLVAAYFLAKLGHSVTVFEAQPEPGGMLRWAIPEYRLPRHILKLDIDFIKKMGVDILTDSPIDSESFIRDLRDKWAALFLATGAPESKRIELEGLSSEGVIWGLEFLRDVKRGKVRELNGKIVVIGGGNVAVDVAMTALRLGASEVQMACLEKREEMPAFPWEIQEAEEEGVVIHDQWGPLKIHSNGTQVQGVELQRCTSVFDEKGYFCPSFDCSEQKTLEAETVILAIGQKTDFSYLPEDLKIQVSKEETIQVKSETLKTNIPGVFAGGEVAFGPGSAVEAMASGRRAASSIDKFLGGQGLDDGSTETTGMKNLWMGRDEDFSSKERIPMTCLPVDERFRSFALIKIGYTEDEAQRESSRCLRCDMRLQILPVSPPPEKWLEFNSESVSQVPESEGAFELLDGEKKIIYIAGTPNLRQALQQQLSEKPEACYFSYEEDPMYTKRESELIQQYLQKHGHLPPGNEAVDDLF